MDEKTYDLQLGLLGGKRTLILSSDFIELKNTNSKKYDSVKVFKAEITDVKYGTYPIIWHRTQVGTTYSISLKGHGDTFLEIKFVGYFSKEYQVLKNYSEIVGHIQMHYLMDIAKARLAELDAGGELIIGRFLLSQIGISVAGTGLNFTWADLQITKHERHFVLWRRSAPEFHIYVDHDQWFTEILYLLILVIKKRQE